MKYLETIIGSRQGLRVEGDDGRMVAIVVTHTEAVRGQPPTMGVPAKPAVPAEKLPPESWSFQFTGRGYSLAELKDMIAGLPGK